MATLPATTLFLHLRPGTGAFIFDTTPPPADAVLVGDSSSLLTQPCLLNQEAGRLAYDGALALLPQDYYASSNPGWQPAALPYEVTLDARAFPLVFYLEVRNPAPSALRLPGVSAPMVARIEATLSALLPGQPNEASRVIGIVAQGATNATLDNLSSNHDEVRGRDVYEVRVPLDVAFTHIPRGAHLQLHVEIRLPLGPCPTGQGIAPPLVGAYSDDGHRPRLVLNATNAAHVEVKQAFLQSDEFHFDAAFANVWGCQAPQMLNASLSVTDSNNRTLWSEDHNRTLEPCEQADLAWRWIYRYFDSDSSKMEGPLDGNYTLLLTVHSMPGNYSLHRQSVLHIQNKAIQTLDGAVPPSRDQFSVFEQKVLAFLLGAGLTMGAAVALFIVISSTEEQNPQSSPNKTDARQRPPPRRKRIPPLEEPHP